MLNYHRINSESFKTTIGIFDHYLSLGAHISPYNISQKLKSFSLIKLYSDSKFVVNAQKFPEDMINYVIPLYGELRVNEQVRKIHQIISFPKYIQEYSRQQVLCIYLMVAKGKETNKNQNQILSSNEINLTEGLAISYHKIKQGDKLQLNQSKYFIFIESGMLTEQDTEEQFQKHEAVFITNGNSVRFNANMDSEYILLKF